MPTITPSAAPFVESLGTTLAWAHPAVSVLSGARMKTHLANCLTGVDMGTEPRGQLSGLSVSGNALMLCVPRMFRFIL